MPFSTFLAIPDDLKTYAERDWSNARGWVWRCEIGRRPRDSHLTFDFEKSHREDETTYFLASVHDYGGKLEERIRNVAGAQPEQLVDEIIARFHVSACGMLPPLHVDLEIRAYLRIWMSLQRSGDSASANQRHSTETAETLAGSLFQ